ncbi:MAG TPA: HAD family hydrolase [Gemmatimonadales bacterium]|nr:HAD family hydrolase [Gemmatimonadales bacterium]
MSGSLSAVFLDRDGTLIADPGYISRPEDVALLPGVAEGLSQLVRRGWPLVIVSNQSGIARGRYGPEAFLATTKRLTDLLAPHGVSFLGAYYCPHHPEFTGPCRCRKPGTLLFEQASREHNLDLPSSWYVGDRWHDLEPALELGGRAVMVRSPETRSEEREASAHGFPVVDDLAQAAEHILAATGIRA